MHVQSFCLSGGTTGRGKISPSVSLTHDDGERSWQISLEWTDLPLIKSHMDNPAEFFYAVLWSLMTDFDDHLVTTVEVGPSMQQEG